MQSGEDGRVDGLFVLRLHQDDAAARTAQRLVRRRRHHVGEGHRIRIAASGNQPGVVCHVDPEDCPDFLGNVGETLEINLQRIGRSTGNDDLRLVLARQRFHAVVVNGLFGVETVGDDIEPLAGHVERHAVRQVTAFGQAHAHDRVARLGESHEHGLVGLRAGVRLDIGAIGTEQRLQPVDGNLLGNIDVLATAVVALARITFRILVGQLRALRLHDRLADIILGGNQFDMLFLATIFALNRLPEFGIHFRQGIFRGKHRSPHKPLKKWLIIAWRRHLERTRTAPEISRRIKPLHNTSRCHRRYQTALPTALLCDNETLFQKNDSGSTERPWVDALFIHLPMLPPQADGSRFFSWF